MFTLYTEIVGGDGWMYHGYFSEEEAIKDGRVFLKQCKKNQKRFIAAIPTLYTYHEDFLEYASCYLSTEKK